MFTISEPTDQRIRSLLAEQQAPDFSYPEAGATRGELPRQYKVLHHRICLGQGAAAYTRAVEAVRRWRMFEVTGVRLCWPSAPIETGAAVAVVVRHFGFWSLNCCRIVYTVDDQGPVRRYGFAYGTLPEHAERGEERFTVEWNSSDDSVWYDVLSFSRPAALAVRAAYPIARRLQERFARESLDAMLRSVAPAGRGEQPPQRPRN